MKNKNHMIKSIDEEKEFDKIYHPLMIKIKQNSQQSGIRGNIPLIKGTNIIKAIYGKLIASIILNGQKLQAFPSRSGTRQGCLLSPLLFNIPLTVLAQQSDK